jgi:predicted nucleotidyltransferase
MGAKPSWYRAFTNLAARVPVASSGAPDKFEISCYLAGMNRQEIIAMLRENEPTLRARGVSHAALFGSRARGDNRPDSDIDIMIEFDPAAHVTVFNYAGLKDYIASLFDGPVDVVNRDGLKPYVRPAATADAIYAF